MGQQCRVHTILTKLDDEVFIWLQLKIVLDTREYQMCQCMVKEVLIQWKDMCPKNVTWESNINI